MPHLTSIHHLNTLVSLVEPLCRTENERLALINTIFVGVDSRPDIDTSGAPGEFTHRLIFRLMDYSEISPGIPALWTLLDIVHKQVGVDKQAQIDVLKEEIAATPNVGFLVTHEGGKLIFLCSASADSAFVQRLRADLSGAGLNLWIDRVNLRVGTPNWEDAIRDAIKQADGVLLIASPASRRSNYVRDELAIADDKGKVIYPVWASGDTWSDSIPLGRGYTQRIDLRGEKYAAGLHELIEVLGGTSPEHAETVQPSDVPLRIDLRDEKYGAGLNESIEVRGGTSPEHAETVQPSDVPLRIDLGDEKYAADLNESIEVLGETSPEHPETVQISDVSLPPGFVPRNPYKGLSAFRAADRKDFFGREMLVAELIDQVRADPRFLAVIGASGSGKSSVVMAGLLPRLQEDPLSKDWIYLDPIVPGKRPLEALSIALAEPLRFIPSHIEQELWHPSTRGLHRLAKQITTTRLVLYIDQFEELFTQTEHEKERRQFIDLLTTAANDPDTAVTILLTLRADFYDRPLSYIDLGRLIEDHGKAILPLTLADLYEVILKPAEQDDVRLTFDPGLTEEMVFSVKGEVGALPLLQFTLDQLFERRDGQRLTRVVYKDLGGVLGALAKHAEATYQTLDGEGQRLARWLFLRLIEPGATEQDTSRRRARLSELTLSDAGQTEQLHAVANTFVQARLVTTDNLADEDTIEVSHEALIREWARLSSWMSEAREDLRIHKSLSAIVAEWIRQGYPDDMLYRGIVLREAQDWATRNMPNLDETRFLNQAVKSEAERAKQDQTIARRVRSFQRILLSLGLAVLFSVLIVSILVILVIQRDRSTFLAVQVNSELLSQNALDAFKSGDFQNALTLSIQANNIDNPPAESQLILSQVTYSRNGELPNGAIFSEFAQRGEVIAVSPKQGFLAVGNASGRLEVYDTLTHQVLYTWSGDNKISVVKFSQDGHYLAWSATSQFIELHDFSTGTHYQLTGHRAIVTDLDFSQNEQLLVSGARDSDAILWNLETKMPLYRAGRQNNFYGPVTSVAFNPQTTHFATGYEDGRVVLWNIVKAEAQYQIENEGQRVIKILFSANGHVLAVATYSGVKIWELATGSLLHGLTKHTGYITAIAFVSQEDWLLTSSTDNTMLLWDYADGKAIREYVTRTMFMKGITADVSNAAFYTVSNTNRIFYWHLDSLNELIERANLLRTTS